MKPALLNVLAVPRTTNYFRVTPVNDAETNHVTQNLLNNNETNNDETEQKKWLGQAVIVTHYLRRPKTKDMIF